MNMTAADMSIKEKRAIFIKSILLDDIIRSGITPTPVKSERFAYVIIRYKPNKTVIPIKLFLLNVTLHNISITKDVPTHIRRISV
ncbi:MAG: hypothetical protein J6B75_05770 [Ruminococcus sp.]|nr:hypothetical protein [Ruminococcus sp.]